MNNGIKPVANDMNAENEGNLVVLPNCAFSADCTARDNPAKMQRKMGKMLLKFMISFCSELVLKMV